MKAPAKRQRDALMDQWRRRVREAEAESFELFGQTPDPTAILNAMVDSSPGLHFRKYIDPLVLEFAAARFLGRADFRP